MSQMCAEAQRLAEYMSELSEEGFYAGWMHGLEFDLWAALMGGSRVYGHLELTDVHLQQLRQLSEACGGWTMAQWLSRFEHWRQQKAHGR